jgi:hypothetical protein
MQKIPTMFDRDWNGDRSRVVNIPHKDCAWVFAGEGIPTRKIDGTCCLVRGGKLYKRRELKAGQPAPSDFEAINVDDETGKTVGWIPVGDGPEDTCHREAFSITVADGTYELVGPKIQGNPEHYDRHRLVPHSALRLPVEDWPPRDFDGLRAWMTGRDIEGVVFHHPDGRMAKIKLRDFGLRRVVPLESSGRVANEKGCMVDQLQGAATPFEGSGHRVEEGKCGIR